MASSISASILSAMHAHIGLKSGSQNKKPRLLPPALVSEFKLLRNLEKTWKSLNSENANAVTEEVTRAEAQYLAQKGKTEGMFFLHRAAQRPTILNQCRGGSPRAKKNFWKHINPKNKQSTEISAVLSPTSGVVHCNYDAIRNDVEQHLTSVFEGSSEKIIPETVAASDHNYSTARRPPEPSVPPDHSYSRNVKLPKTTNDAQLDTDPDGWLNSDFTMSEV